MFTNPGPTPPSVYAARVEPPAWADPEPVRFPSRAPEPMICGMPEEEAVSVTGVPNEQPPSIVTEAVGDPDEVLLQFPKILKLLSVTVFAKDGSAARIISMCILS